MTPTGARATGAAVPVERAAKAGDVALAGADGRLAAELLRNAVRQGTAVLAAATAAAVARLKRQGVDAARAATAIYSDAERRQIADALAATNATAELLGGVRVRDRLAAVREGVSLHAEDATPYRSFADGAAVPLYEPLQALSYFRGLVPSLAADDPARFGLRHERAAFTLAAATDLQVLAKVQRAIADAVAAGTPRGDIAVADVLDAAGVSRRNPGYSEMVFRTNAMDSYNAGATRELQAPDVVDEFPAWLYLGIKDGRQGRDHERHFGRYFPSRVPFALVRGPRVFNCRCTSAPVHRTEWEALKRRGVAFSTYAERPARGLCRCAGGHDADRG